MTDALTDDPRPDGLRSATSLVLVHTGNGKGKSSSAFGVMLRALAVDWRVAVCQFQSSRATGRSARRRWAVSSASTGGPSATGSPGTPTTSTTTSPTPARGWAEAKAVIEAGEHQLVVLDELTYLCSWGWIDEADVIATIRDRPEHVSVVITGRDAPDSLIAIADTVTEMTEVKHAYQQGIRAKRGIDY